MWTRERIKREARNGLRRFGYWMPLLVTFVTGLLTGTGGQGSTSMTNSMTAEYTYEFGEDITPAGLVNFFEEFFGEFGEALENFFTNPLIAMTTAFFIVLVFVIGLATAFCWSLFVGGPVTVGKNRYFMEHRAFDSKFDRLFFSFRKGRYSNTVKTLFWYNLKIFLWRLLFIIPGIIKSYEYFMVPYILAENPQISTERAFEISKAVTKGEKWKMFVLDLSFIGWIILGLLCCGIGVFFLQPYMEATYAELYQVMREKAHGLGFADYNDLPGFFPEEG